MATFKKLLKHPLVCVLVEVRFSSVLSLEDYIPKVQDRLRKDYPLFDKDAEQSINVTPAGINVQNNNKWVFTSKDKSSAFQLTPDRLVFLTTNYDRFDGFADRVRNLLEAVAEVVSPSLYSRLGLRYCDCIKTPPKVDDDESLRALFSDESPFFSPQLEKLGTCHSHRTESALRTEHGMLIVRSLLAYSNMKMLEDLTRKNYVEIPNDEQPSVRVILDFDHFWQDNENQKDFNVDEIVSSLHNLHETSRQAFWDITSVHAKENVWSQ